MAWPLLLSSLGRSILQAFPCIGCEGSFELAKQLLGNSNLYMSSSTKDNRPSNERMRRERVEAQDNLTTEDLPSKAAGISWMLGLMSIPLLFFPPAGVITGFLAVIFGHVANYKIRKHPEVGGSGVATIGLLLGYMCFVGGLALLPTMRMQASVVDGFFNSWHGQTVGAPGTELEAVEKHLLNDSAPSAGNSDDAKKIASDICEVLNQQRQETFSVSSAMPVQVHVQAIEDQGICVIVVVPDLADFGSHAREAMLNFAWKESQRAAFAKCTPGDQFVVAVRDRLRYHSMEFGRATKSPDRIAQPDSAFVDETMLEPWFKGSEADADAE